MKYAHPSDHAPFGSFGAKSDDIEFGAGVITREARTGSEF